MLDTSFLSAFGDTDATSVDGRRNRRRRLRMRYGPRSRDGVRPITAGAHVDVYGAGRHVTAPPMCRCCFRICADAMLAA